MSEQNRESAGILSSIIFFVIAISSAVILLMASAVIWIGELIGEVVWDTKTNLEKRTEAEHGACEDKFRLATLAKQENLDAVHDTVHEMAKDEARHGAGFQGLYNRYFGK